MAELTIAAGIARGLMELAVSKGASQAVLAERSGIDPAEVQDQDNRVAFPKYVKLMQAAKELTNDPALALHYAEAIDFSEVSIVGLITLASETMADAFAQMNRFGRLAVEVEGVESGDRFVLTRHERIKGQLWLTDTRKNPNDFPELTETTFGRMACGTRRFGNTPFIKAVHVTHPAPVYRSEYDRIFRVPVFFERDKNALLVDEEWANNRVALSPRYVFGILSEHANALLESLQNSKTVRGRVGSLLLPILHTGNANMEAIAAKMGLSRQTLFRRLKAEDATFEKVLDELRHKVALHYLNGKRVSIYEIAYLVGFSDPSAFSRAFKRWTGTSPGTMRALAIGNNQKKSV